METESLDLHAELGSYVTLVSVEIREQPLAFLHSSYGVSANTGSKIFFKHDFVILTAIDRNDEEFSFVAEKIRDFTLCNGLRSHISIARLSEEASSFPSRFVWQLHNLIVSTTELKMILSNTGDHYDLFSANCWKYAADTVVGVLNLGLRQSRRMKDSNGVECCTEGLRELETVRRVLPREGFGLFSNPFSSESYDTWVRIRAGIQERLTRFFHPSGAPSPRYYDYTNTQTGLTPCYFNVGSQ